MTKTKGEKRQSRANGNATQSRKSNGSNGQRRRNGRRNGGGGGRRSKRKPSELDVNSLVKKAVPVAEQPKEPRRTFREMPIAGKLLKQIERKGFTHATEIQDKTFESIVEGRDIMGIANTGTGKTGAFLIPLIHQLLTEPEEFQTLIMVPTRELAEQVEQEFRSITKGLKLYVTCVIGGTNIRTDIQRLRRPSHLVVGTPGRIIDLMKRKVLHLEFFSTLILDEFDRMLDMGFVNDVQKVAEVMYDRDQTMLFSATENDKQQKIIDGLLMNPKVVRISEGKSSDNVDQDIVRIGKDEDKYDVFLNLLQQDECEKVLVFAETKRWVDKLTRKLRKSGIKADQIHGDKTQGYRKKALDKFKKDHINVLVATDVAARGIDVDDVSHVINYDVPRDMESYVHRIGRTGRAGKTGKALTLVG